MGDLDYAYGKLGLGVETLATHPGEVKARLIAAFSHLVGVNPDALPDEPKRIWLEVWEKATNGSDREGSLAAINDLDEAGAVELAKSITAVESMVRGQIPGPR